MDSSGRRKYLPGVREDNAAQQPQLQPTSTDQSGEGSGTDSKNDEMTMGDSIEGWGSSRQGKTDEYEDGEDTTAVNSKSSSSANSLYHTGMKDDFLKKSSEQEIIEPINAADEPYHVYSKAEKMKIVYLVSCLGIFSPLSSNIYFPAMGRIASELHINFSSVNLSITVYMIVQALAPSVWGPFSDSIGRRPIFVATMLVYLAANIGLATSTNFAGLMVFRGIQAAGSAATISIGSGVIGDIATADERGGMMGTFAGTRMFGQALGPVIGGVITQLVGFRGIFWFLLIIGSMSLLLLISFVPETLRPIAGNGTTRLVGFQRPLIYHFKGQPNVQKEQDPDAPKRRVTAGSIFSPLRLLMEKDVFITLFFGSIIYTVWSMVTSSTTLLFQNRFGINDFQVGLAFLPNGFGCVIGSYSTGKLLDYDFKKTEREYRKAKNIPDDVKIDRKTLTDFPIEKARMRNIWWIILLNVVTTVLYGYSFHWKQIVAPLILQFFISSTATSVFSINSTLVVDLYPGMSASATAVNNLARCSLGAVGVAFVEPIIEKIGAEKTFIIFGFITLVVAPLLVLEMAFGQKWRTARAIRLKKKQQERNETTAEKGTVELGQNISELEERIRVLAGAKSVEEGVRN